MRRAILLVPALATVLAAAVLATPAAADAPQIQDGVGDTAVPSQDIASGLITVANGQLHVALTLRAAPMVGVPTTYAVGLYTGAGCAGYVFEYNWHGVASESTAYLDGFPSSTCSATPESPASSVPATESVSANVLNLSAPLPGALPVGTVVTAYAETTDGLVVVTGPGSGATSVGGDIAYGDGPFSLG